MPGFYEDLQMGRPPPGKPAAECILPAREKEKLLRGLKLAAPALWYE